MLPLKNRLDLRRKKDFFARAKRSHLSLCAMYLWVEKGERPSCLGAVVVSQKVDRSSAARNRIKRRLRSILSSCFLKLGQRRGVSPLSVEVVLVANPKVKTTKKEEWKKLAMELYEEIRSWIY